ncbi:DNA-formamidopyrimidine glycosylase family protein [Pseudactinotalea sp. Z1732]|uniref:DNA-formamidopyrimidine glycosylase family protein n=1 Tax=Micrococcales TaxID=85006 RepID=UPI003C7CFEB9
MPEGDVVARVARHLTRALTTGPLVRAELRWPGLGDADLTGQQVSECLGYGKHLFIRTGNGWSLHTHLRMDGTWRVRRTAAPPEALRGRWIRAVLATARWTCVGSHLGMMDLVRARDERRLIAHLGPDLMAKHPDLDGAARNLHAQGSRGVGESLLDQRVAAGMGTIYMAETLWEHRLSPWLPADRVPDPRALYATASFLMRRSADAPELTATGHLGAGLRTHVHDRAGKPCRRCGEMIAVAEVAAPPLARPAFYCPGCQEGRRAGAGY